MISTKQFKLTNSAYIKALFWAWLGRWWWTFAIPAMALLIIGLYDWRWWVAGIFLAVVAYPGALALVYFYYALSPEAVRMILSQVIEFGDDKFTITYFPLEENGKGIAPRTIVYEEIKKVEDTGRYYRINLRGNEIIVVPVAAFASREDSILVLQKLTQKNP